MSRKVIHWAVGKNSRNRASCVRLYTVLLGAVLLTVYQAGCDSQREKQNLPQAGRLEKAQFVGRQTCIECHEEQYKEWIGSHHDRSMDVATEETVLGNFNNTTFTNYGLTTTFYKSNGRFLVRTDGPDGKLNNYEISYVFGFDPLQQYMIAFPDGRIQVLDIGWDTHPRGDGGQRWFHLHPDEKITSRHIFHWTRRFLNWNYMCAECHSTNLQKNFDLETNTFKTAWSEIDVGCEACHGPGSNHVEWSRDNGRKDPQTDRYSNLGLEVNLRAEDSRVQVEACARCHSRRNGLRRNYRYGKAFMDDYVPQILIDPYYYADGQILDEVYVYGSFIQSKKYHKGVRCTDCHNPHTARLHTGGNELCNRCHASSPSRQFEMLTRKNYDTPEHHFHEQNSPAGECVECHMPETKYMIVDPRRDHSFQIPRPDLSVKLDIPNACNRCHKDKSPQWAADKVNEWYPLSRDKREKDTHFAEIFAAGQAGKPEAESLLVKVVLDRSRPAIIRATALNILSTYRSLEALKVTASALEDNDPLVRYEAARGVSALIPKRLGNEDQQKKYSHLVPLLKDPIRAVRTEAARGLAEVPAELFDQLHRKDFERALDEYKERQQSIADRPEAHLNLGLIYQNLGQNDMAEDSYRTAIRLVYDFAPARFNLANLYNSMGRNKDAEEQFREIINLDPGDGEAYYSLGLLLAEMNRLDDAVGSLAKAVQLIPDRARVRYNYALALRHVGKNRDAEKEMLKAYQSDPWDPGILHTLTLFYMQEGQWDQALRFARELEDLVPDASGPKQLVIHIEKQLSSQGDQQ